LSAVIRSVEDSVYVTVISSPQVSGRGRCESAANVRVYGLPRSGYLASIFATISDAEFGEQSANPPAVVGLGALDETAGCFPGRGRIW
jgi:hypothetical protein